MNPLRGRTGQYGLALLAVGASALLRWLMPDVLSRAPYLGFYPAVVMAAILGGVGPGLVATFASLLLVNLVFVQFDFLDYGLQMRNVIWIVGSAGVSLLAGWLCEARDRVERFNVELAQRVAAQTVEIRDANATLEQRVMDRTRALEQANAELRRSGRAALNLVQDAAAARQRAEQAAEALGEQKELLAVTLASISDAVIVTDIHGRITFVNREAERLCGWTMAEAAGEPASAVFRIINERTRIDVESPVEQILRSGDVVGLADHTLLVARDGRETPIDDSGAPVRSADGAIHGVVVVFRDISARYAAEEALRLSEAKFATAFANNPAAICLTRLDDGLYYDVNDTWSTMTGWRRDEAIANSARTINIWPSSDDVARFLDELRTTGVLRGWEQTFLRKSGEPFVAELSAQVLTVNGETAILSTLVDITARKRADEQLKAAKRAAEQARAVAESANRAKDQFIAVLSHELRTPLTPAVAALSLLRSDVRLPADVREDLEMVSRNIDLEVRLIADLLDVSRIISGKLHLEKRPVDVAQTICEAAKIVSGDLDAKGQVLIIETPGAPYTAFADAARLQQVFWNLLRNSIKFSPERGEISIRATVEPAEAGIGSGNVIVQVVDHGSGIAPAMLPRLFNAFEQEEKARSFGGLGLGLAICKAVVDMHGGSIWASSEGVGSGATFTVRLPLAQHTASSALDAARQGQQTLGVGLGAHGKGRLEILLVEDHPDTAKLMRRLLAAQGHRVISAGSVSEGLAAVRARMPDLLISDLGLPDGSGLDLIRELVEEGKRVPAIALSGYGNPGDIERSRAAGFAEHLTKPLTGIEPLVAAIARLGIGRRHGG